MPNPIIPSLKYMAYGFITTAIYVVLGNMYFPVQYCWSPEFVTEHSFAYRLVYAGFAWEFKKFMYYTGFMFETGLLIACGFGYNGPDPENKGEHLWDKFMAVYLINAETSTNANTFLRWWNYRIYIFLKHYVLERLIKPGERPTAVTYFTIFAIMAFWHGFYPQYYIVYFFVFLVTNTHKEIYGCGFLFRAIPKQLRTVICIIGSNWMINYGGILQEARTLENGSKFLNATYYYLFVFCFIFLAITKGFGLVRMVKKMER